MAHIPDGFLSGPVVLGTAVASAGALALAAARSREQLAEREAPLLGAATAFVFAAQMLNLPLGAGTSAHLLGGVLVATVLGPWAAMLVLFSVLLVQALLFQDGGIAALGANTLNLAVLAIGGGYAVYRWALALLGASARARVVSAGLGAYVSTAVVGAAVAVELALSRTVPIGPALAVVGGSHLVVALGEALITAAVVAALLRSRPGLLEGVASPTVTGRRWAILAGAASLALAVGAVYVASAKPDALEAAAERLGIAGSEAAGLGGLFPGYEGAWGGPWLAATLGVVLLFAVGWGVARALRRARSTP